MPELTPQAFVEKWSKSTLKETAAYSEHFIDICRMVGHPTPAEMDPTGTRFTFQKGVTKNAEGADVIEDTLFGGQRVKGGAAQGFADVWFKGHFAWEYKGKHKDLEKAREQLLQYMADLQNPPLLVVCDFERYEIHTNFNNCIKIRFCFTNEDIVKPETLAKLHALFENPDFFKPTKTTRSVTEDVAKQFATLAERMRKRDVEPHRAAHFLMKLLFCLFAEDVGLLPNDIFSKIVGKAVGRFDGGKAEEDVSIPLTPRKSAGDAKEFDFLSKHLRQLFRAMKRGGVFAMENIDYFNGGLFDDDEVFDLDAQDIEVLHYCCKQDWSSIEPSIFGTLFQRSLDPSKRSQLGAHYTSEEDIVTLVEPVLMQPLRREWDDVKVKLAGLVKRRDEASGREYFKRNKLLLKALEDFEQRLSLVKVLDPACGSGNFLYVSLNLLKELEKEVFTSAAKCGHSMFRLVHPDQLYGIEINPYAAELARLVVWIGHIQWDKNNGLYRPESPILTPLKNIKEMDAILDLSSGTPAEPKWPECEVIVGNPPFLGGNKIRKELGDKPIDALFALYEGRVGAFADLCCYWFERARKQIENRKCKRAGLLATQGIRGGVNRGVLKRIKETGDIFFAISDRDWILDGASVHISMVAFDDGKESTKNLDGENVSEINPNLSSTSDVTTAACLKSNAKSCFMGPSPKGPFDIDEGMALKFLRDMSSHGRANSDVVRPVFSATDLTQVPRNLWTLDFDEMPMREALAYDEPFELVKRRVFPIRSKNRRISYAQKWWQYAEARPGMRKTLTSLRRFLVTPAVAKHRCFLWRNAEALCNQGTFVFPRDDDYFFGVLHSRFHEIWSRAQGTQVRERESGFRYTPTSCFETFPLPHPSQNQEKSIAAAAKELDKLRNAWLNPPEWTKEEVLTFPGSVSGPWARYVTKANAQGIGTVHYPRIVPVDAESARKLAKRTLTNLCNERPAWLDLAHNKLDEAVSAAYGWPADLTDDHILEKLLSLNLERAKGEPQESV